MFIDMSETLRFDPSTRLVLRDHSQNVLSSGQLLIVLIGDVFAWKPVVASQKCDARHTHLSGSLYGI